MPKAIHKKKWLSFWALPRRLRGPGKKSLPSAVYAAQRKEIQRVISKALTQGAASALNIAKLSDAAVKLEKCIKYVIDNPLG